METLVKQLIACLGATLVLLVAGGIARIPMFGGMAAMVPIMVGILLIWDAYSADGRSCRTCYRDNLNGRGFFLADWYRDEHLNCPSCGRRMVQAGDRLFDAPAAEGDAR